MNTSSGLVWFENEKLPFPDFFYHCGMAVVKAQDERDIDKG